jgi:ribosomal protein S1
VGWVFVNRTPVRGEKSRRAIRESQPSSDKPGKGVAKVKVSAEAMKPMPVPKSLPPGATLPAKKIDNSKSVNDILPFLQFVEKNTVGSVVVGVVESYSSHGAYVTLGDVRGYVPLRLLGSPPPRSAREVMQLGESVTLEIVEIIAGRRSIDLVPTTKSVSEVALKSKKKAVVKKAASAKKATPAKKAAPVKKAAPAKKAAPVKKDAPVKKATPIKKAVPVKKVASAKKAAPAKKSAPEKKAAPVKKAAPAKKAVAKKVATKAAPRRK